MFPKKTTFPLSVEPFQEDYSGRLSWANFGNLVLRCASLHAEENGFGITYMQEHHQGWVLSRLALEMTEMPASLEPYSITTWVSKIFRQFTDRNFSIEGPDGKIYGYGISTWALIDYETRQPVNLENLEHGGFSACLLEEVPPISTYARARVKNEELAGTHDCCFTDLDLNGHVNSIRYVDMGMNLFPLEWHREHPLRRIELAFGLEGHCGDHLEILKENLGDNRFAVEIRRPADNVTLVRSILTFA